MALALDPTTRDQLRRQVGELSHEFSDVLSRDIVEHAFEQSLDGLSDARFADFVPVLAHRFARERLGRVARAAVGPR
jgi:hypothetical protein